MACLHLQHKKVSTITVRERERERERDREGGREAALEGKVCVCEIGYLPTYLCM